MAQENKQNCREMWDTIKQSNIQIKEVPEREVEKEQTKIRRGSG